VTKRFLAALERTERERERRFGARFIFERRTKIVFFLRGEGFIVVVVMGASLGRGNAPTKTKAKLEEELEEEE